MGNKGAFIGICKAMLKAGIKPDFITIDGGEGETGAAPLEFSNPVGMPYRKALAFTYNVLKRFGIKVYLLAGCVLSLGIACDSGITQKDFASEPVSHEIWDQLLHQYVTKNGKVDYRGIRKDREQLEKYLEQLASNHPDRDWKKNERLAYWVNAYNAFTIELVLKHYPIESIKDIGGLLKSPFRIEFIKIQGEEYSLGAIEHQILRKRFDEPRIHFAINCASVSCPDLKNEAYTANKIEQQLNERAITFINNPSKNKIAREHAEISAIFNWFESDFTQKGSLIDFLNQYSKVRIDPDAEVDYMDYDWKLNDARN